MGDAVPTDQVSHNRCDCTDSHCNSHIVALCFSSQPLSQDDGGGYLQQCLRGGRHQGDAENEGPEPKDAHEEGKPCLICQDTIFQDTSHEATLPRSKSDVNQQPITGLSQGQRGPLRSREQCACFCLTPHYETSRQPPARSCSWVSPSMSTSDGEYLPPCHLHSAFFSDRVRGARTCRHPCSAFSSDRIRGSSYNVRERGARTCCLP